MLRRISSLILVLIVGGSVLAASVHPVGGHFCSMMGAAGDMQSMSCCERAESGSINFVPAAPESCCLSLPPQTSSNEPSSNLRPPAPRVAVLHLAALPPRTRPNLPELSFVVVIFLPDLQTSYIRNHSLLI